MAFEFPRAKKEVCWRRRVLVVISNKEKLRVDRREDWSSNTRMRGMFVARVWVISTRTRRS